MSDQNLKVDSYLERATRWKDVQEQLRSVLLDCGLTEELKWGKPCYTFDGKNIVIVQAFKSICALMFFKGALMPDPEGVLKEQGPNSQAARRMEFSGANEVNEQEATLKAYIAAAIEIEKSGKQIQFKAKEELEYPEELTFKLDEDSDLRRAFEALTPGRQRGHVMYLNSAKQSETRISRIEKSRHKIMAGKGFNER